MGHGARVLIDRLRERQISDKGLGQHFLHDESVLDSIIQSAELSEHDSIIEIGPGPGVLTERLLEAGVDLFCIELDSGVGKFKINVNKFGDFVEKITKENSLRPYPDINDIPN